MEQLCLTAKESYPDDPMVQSDAFQLICPKNAYQDQYRSKCRLRYHTPCLLLSIVLAVLLFMHLVKICVLPEFPEFTEEYVDAIKTLWRSPLLEKVWEKRSDLQVDDTSAIFLDRIDEISDFAYMPTESDIVYARIKTSGIREEKLSIDDQVSSLHVLCLYCYCNY